MLFEKVLYMGCLLETNVILPISLAGRRREATNILGGEIKEKFYILANFFVHFSFLIRGFITKKGTEIFSIINTYLFYIISFLVF